MIIETSGAIKTTVFKILQLNHSKSTNKLNSNCLHTALKLEKIAEPSYIIYAYMLACIRYFLIKTIS